ncbi:MAG: S8 family serine peptidase [Kofleriaceae bacterium]
MIKARAVRVSRSRRFSLLAGAAAVMFAWGCGSDESTTATQDRAGETTGSKDTSAAPPAGKLEFAPDSILVRFKASGVSARAQAAALDKVKGTFEDANGDGIYDRFTNVDKTGTLMKVDLARGTSPQDAVALLRQDPSVQYAELNYIVRASAIPSDPRFGELYGLNNTGQTGGTADADIDAVEAWDTSTGSSDVVVAVIDTGVDYNHVDLAANMWTNPDEIPGNGLDDDGNGVIDDVHGYNAITNGGNPLDDNDHGSHCSGTIGAVGDNGVGVAGVNWDVSIMAIKFLSAAGSGTTADAIEGIDYAVGRKNAGVNLRVLSNSWGGGGFSQALADSIQAANDADLLFVAAAGNAGSNNDATPSYPASYDLPNVVSVAATDHNDGLASFSNFGATTVDLGAPGVSVLSTTRNNTYSVFSGTSMATPHVAGAAALVLSANSTLSTAELKDILLTSGDLKPSLAGKTLSGRRLNAANALAEAGPPVPRFNLAASPASRVINQGDSTTFDLDLSPVAGFTGTVALSASAVPAFNGVLEAVPSSVGVPGVSTLNVVSSTATAVGTYAVTVTGTSGALTKSRTVTVLVRPEGTVEVSFPSTDTPLPIPSGPPTGINSVITVTQPMLLAEVQVEVNITHTWIGDLLVTLRSPEGTTVVLHNRSGGSADNIHQTYVLPTQYTGQQAAGDWTLHVDDNFSADVGTLDSWTLHLIGAPTAPTFDLHGSPAAQIISQGDTATYDVTAVPLGAFTGAIDLSATAEPALDAALSFSAGTIGAPGTSTLTVATGCATAPGTYAITVTGTSDGTVVTTEFALTVHPFGTTEVAYPSSDTPRPIPDNAPAGIDSIVNVPEGISVLGLAAEVHIAHTWIGDLSVSLIGPNGQTVVLHNRTGGSADNIDQTYVVTDFDGQLAQGEWKLHVADHLIGFAGTLTSWTLHLTGSTGPQAPAAAFSYAANRLSVAFTDESMDTGCGGGGVAAWAWSFGDGETSTAQHPTHVYAAAGTYTVTLTVTDDDGLTGSTSQTLTVTKPNPTLAIERILRNRATFEFAVDLTWAGAQGALVELYRNGLLVDIPNNDGAQRDQFRRYETSFTWKICEQFVDFCSNEVSVVFGSSEDSATIVTKGEDGNSISRVVPIEDVK